MRRDTREGLANQDSPPSHLARFLGWDLRERGRRPLAASCHWHGEACSLLGCLCAAFRHGSPGKAPYGTPAEQRQPEPKGGWLDGLASEPGCQPSWEQVRGSTEGWPPESQPPPPSWASPGHGIPLEATGHGPSSVGVLMKNGRAISALQIKGPSIYYRAAEDEH